MFKSGLIDCSDDIEGIFEPIVRGVEGLISQQASAITKLGFSAVVMHSFNSIARATDLFRRLHLSADSELPSISFADWKRHIQR